MSAVDVRYKSHEKVVELVKACKEEMVLYVTTPEPKSGARLDEEDENAESAATPIVDPLEQST